MADGVKKSIRKMKRPQTVLLLGCTGSGKTPLGDLLERRGFRGRRCFHLDFGANLRAVAAGELQVDGVDGAAAGSVLEAARLLEDEEFVIAERIVAAFVDRTGITADDLMILNGLPRHVSQADDVDRILNVTGLLYLRCDAHTVHERIRLNSGGDRVGRADDSEADIAGKLEIFEQRTIPLLDRYRGKGVRIAQMEVTVESTAAEMLQRLERRVNGES